MNGYIVNIFVFSLIILILRTDVRCQRFNRYTTSRPPSHSLWRPPISTNTTLPRRAPPAKNDPVIESRNGKCGIRPNLRQKRITGGRNARPGDWPWQVSLMQRRFYGLPHLHRCGGALLNVNWVVTSAHCVYRLTPFLLLLRMGEYDLSNMWETRAHVERLAHKIIVHPKYDPNTLEYDIALVELSYPVAFLPHVAPLCLPQNDDPLIGQLSIITGWGRLKENGALPKVLQEVTVRIISNEKCESMFRKAGHNEHIPDIFLCTDYITRQPASHCQGDSGGPLQIKSKDGFWFLAGIISWGISCSDPHLPGVYIRISRFKSWLLNNMKIT